MLIYANKFVFEPDDGPQQIIGLVANWIGQRAKQRVDPIRLGEGIRDLRLNDGSCVTSRATIDAEKKVMYPYVFCAQLSHGDEKVAGRRWITEVGIRQESESASVECSVLLKTDEVSAKVVERIQVTRPKLVKQLIEKCSPVGQTPGLTIKRLDVESATAFLREVERNERAYPIVLISSSRDGAYPIDPKKLREILVGLSDVVQVPVDVDTFELQEIVTRKYVAFGGAVNIIFPSRIGDRGPFCESIVLRPDQINDILENGKRLDSEILATITHRTNLPNSWRHISLEMVHQAVLRGRLSQMLLRAKESHSAEDLSEYIALLEEADREIRVKDAELAQIRREYEDKENEHRIFLAKITSLEHALAGRQNSDDSQDEDIIAAIKPMREMVVAVTRENPSIQQSLELISALYPDRIAVLQTAISAARESDRAGCRLGAKAFELLTKLANEYWEALADGRGDQQARVVFGLNGYAQNEGEALSDSGVQRRTFIYQGRSFLMKRHLKHGVKQSVAETLRIHFEWIAEEKRLVIGHCGKHLDF